MSDLEGFGFVLPHWFYWGWLAVMPVIMMLWSHHQEKKHPRLHPEPDMDVLPEVLADEDPTQHYAGLGNWFTRIIDWISEHSGVFVAFWTVNAVVAYFYEVVMRYLFNQPTIWVHEASFLLFGMQYLLAGAFAYREDAHVRVDVIYNYFSTRTKAVIDVVTSIFFFIFTVALLWSGWIFMVDAVAVLEVSFTEWAIQYWPVKATIFLGAVLIVMQGVSKLAADVAALTR